MTDRPPGKPKKATARRRAAKPAKAGKAPAKTARPKPAKPGAPVLLSGGNPQIPKGEGDAPVQAYLDAMPGWKQAVGRRVDALIVKTVPGVHKAVKWNTPLYGIEDEGWFIAYHCFTQYLKITFFRGTALHPIPPEPSKSGDTRYYHIHEDEDWDEAQFVDWVKQASKLPGERM